MIFAMVSTARSVAYTRIALPSFFRHTPLAADDKVVLIVNEPGGLPDLDALGIDRARLEVVDNPAPRSFAANANMALRRARSRRCGLVFLNNDIVFTPGWLAPVVADENAITLPACNQQYRYARDGLDLDFLMSIEGFGGRQAALEAIAADHAAAFAYTPWRRDRIMMFYCVHIPFAVAAAVGDFDEAYGSGGGEDIDYRLRALIAGFDVRYANRAFVLHFVGASTWRSGEAAEVTTQRDAVYRGRFAAKWGETLLTLFMSYPDVGPLARELGVGEILERSDYVGLVRHFAPEGPRERHAEKAGAPRLCLNMIVKNETAILERCLGAVADHVACWVIGDTGSSDGTPEMIERFFAARGIPGELHRFPFENFGQARNEALARARRSPLPFDYLLLVDADMELVVTDPAFREGLDAPAYRLRQQAGISYWNLRLVARDTAADYQGVTHEYLEVPAGGEARLEGAHFVDHASGANRVDKFERDIRLLAEGIATAPNVARYHFYLAQSYRDAGRWEDAARTYAHRAALGGWDEEVWYSRLQEARCLRELGRDAEFVGKALAAYETRPHRAEPLRDVANHYRLRGMNHAGAMVAEAGLDIPYPAGDSLFVEDDVYNGGLLEEYAITANYSRSPAQRIRGGRACDRLALSRMVPPPRRDTARRNLIFYARPLREMLADAVFKRLEPALEPGWSPMNPSVTLWRGELRMIQRAVNYTLADGVYTMSPAGAPSTTRNFLTTLDRDLAIGDMTEILPPEYLPAPLFPHVLGFEDMRLIARGDELWCASTVREMNAAGWCEQYLARIEPAPGGPCRLTRLRKLSAPTPDRHEKNWTPQVADGALLFIYTYQDNIVVSEAAAVVSRSESDLAVDHLRGGSQAVPFEDGWLSVCHEVVVWDGARRYLHRFAWFDEGMALRRLSDPFTLSGRPIEFAAGLALHPDGETLVVSYGVEDRESWLVRLSRAAVWRLLNRPERQDAG